MRKIELELKADRGNLGINLTIKDGARFAFHQAVPRSSYGSRGAVHGPAERER